MSFFKSVGGVIFFGTAVFAAEPPFQPPRETPLVEIPKEKAPSDGISEKGQMALKIAPDKWKVAETPNFYIHFRRATEARKVAREIEYNLAYVAHQLGADPESYARKSHAYVFEDASEWFGFIDKARMPEWTSSFAYHDELFLNVRGKNGGDFDSQTLAHETTHAVIARIYGERRWPLWLNEGFAEYMGGASIASRKNQLLRRFQKDLETADMPLDELVKLERYPTSLLDVARLYQTGEKFVRFLMEHGTSQQFVTLADALVAGKTLPEAVAAGYVEKFPDYAAFEKQFAAYQSNPLRKPNSRP